MTIEYKVIDKSHWVRQQQFDFYQDFEQPYFHIGFDLDATHLYQYCKAQKLSFFAAYLFLLQKSLNQLEPFRLRIVEGEVRDYQQLALDCAILAEDQTVRFCHIPYAAEFELFTRQLELAKQQALAQPFIADSFTKDQQRLNTVYMSVIPWISFTSFNHAQRGKDGRGLPRLVVGKMRQKDFSLPFGVDVHHGLVDGLHVGQLLQTLQQHFDDFKIK